MSAVLAPVSHSPSSLYTIDTPAFRSWFARSHAVDAAGKPLPMFHGTGADTGDVFWPGTYFTPRPDVAAIYAAAPTRQTDEASPSLTPVYLSLQNPFYFDASSVNDNLSHHVLGKRGRIPDVIAKLHAEGFDSLIIKNYDDLGGVQDQYVVFSSTQVKSPFNLGNFDPQNMNIRFSMPNDQGHNTSSMGDIPTVQAITQTFPGLTTTKLDSYPTTPSRTDRFQAWFGTSIARNADGEPQIVYRGEHGATDDGDIQTNLGSFTFTNNPAVASTYAQSPNDRSMTAKSPRIVPAFISIQNPIIENKDDPFVDFSDLSKRLGPGLAARFASKHAQWIENTGNWVDHFADKYPSVDALLSHEPLALDELYMDSYPLLDDPEFLEAAKAAGYDGAVHMGNGESYNSLEYRVFDKSQIKSTLSNNGQYSRLNQDIRFSQSLPAEAPATPAPLLSWFGQSAVTDKTGMPLQVYHGTARSFSIFSEKRLGNKTGALDAQSGFFFAENPRAAEQFIWEGGSTDGGNLMPVHLKIENPLILKDLVLDGGNGSLIGKLIQKAKADGHDGVIFEQSNMLGHTGRVFAVFSPHQIKSAIGNRGTYDSASPDIRHSLQFAAVGQPQIPTKSASLKSTIQGVKAAIAQLIGTPSEQLPNGLGKILVLNSHEVPADWRPVINHHLRTSVASMSENSLDEVSDIHLQRLLRTATRSRAQAFFDPITGTTALIADRIDAGQEAGVFLHEITHKYGRDELGDKAWRSLVGQVQIWSRAPVGSTERMIHDAAQRRAYNSGASEDIYSEELFAYAVEEAVKLDIKPSAAAAEHSSEYWLSQVVASIERVVQKLTGRNQNNLTLQDVVDLSYALAQLETPLHREQIQLALKSALQATDASDKQSRQHPCDETVRPIWYSALTRAISSATMNSAPAKDWSAYIRGLVTKGVKHDEIEWSGVQDWLALQPGKVSRQDVTTYLAVNGVQIKEVILGGDEDTFKDALDRLTRDGFTLESDGYFGVDLYRDGLEVSIDELSPRQCSDLLVLRDAEDAEAPLETGTAKYPTFQIPGGKNYRELVLVLPEQTVLDVELAKQLTVETTMDGGQELYFICKNGNPNALPKTYASRAQAVHALKRMVEHPAATFNTPHWSENNVLAHIRFNERADTAGKKVLFVQEIQSDWGQNGKKQGFIGPDTTIEGKTASEWQNEAQDLFGKWSGDSDPLLAQWQAAAKNGRILRDKYKEMGLSDVVEIPSGPFVMKTEAWLTLSLKRVISYAVEHDFDQVGFISGEQSARQFNLTKEVDHLELEGTHPYYSISAYDAAGKRVIHDTCSAEKLNKIIGKGMAARLIAAPETTIDGDTDHKPRAVRLLSGLDCKVGGDGIKVFYDTIVPIAAKKLLSRLGGPGLSTTEIDCPDCKNGSMSQVGFEITAHLRALVAAGLPMFSLRDDEYGEEVEPEVLHPALF